MKVENQAHLEVKTQTAKGVKLSELSEKDETGPTLFNGNFSIISGLKVNIEVFAGSAELTVEELFSLKKGSVIPLSQLLNAPMLIKLDGKTIASGSLVVVGDNFGVCINEILAIPPAE